MRIAVIGAGIVGVTSAYELALQGHEVTVHERRGSVAAEGSFANAGMLGPAGVAPWAAPGMAWRMLRRAWRSDAALRISALGALAELPWLWRWWRACQPQLHQANHGAMLGLARLSVERMGELSQQLRLDYEQARGHLILLRSERALAHGRRSLALLADAGLAHEVLDPARARQLEPGLAEGAPLHAAIHLPQGGVGNCRQFAQLIKAEAQRLGARFRFDSQVTALQAGAQPRLRLRSGQADGEETHDAVLVCAGADAGRLLRPLGLRLPLLAVQGYALTAPVRHQDGGPFSGPRAGVLDPHYQVSIARLGQRLRVAGSAEIGADPGALNAATLRTLYKVLDDWFPGAASQREAQHWKGARPMLPDGPPVLGASGLPGIWLNLGHGANGWALASGSARVLAEQLAGRAAPLDVARLGLQRLGR